MPTGPSASPDLAYAQAIQPASKAYLLLVFTTLIWGANAVAARLAVGEVSPMFLTFMRWGISCVALALFARGPIRAHWSTLAPRWRSISLMGALGFTGFNALFYTAAHHTTAINIAILQGAIPVLVLIGSVIFFSNRVSALQWLGVLITLAGIAVVASHGHLGQLARLDFNIGDIWMIVAGVLYAGYMLGL
ncbi:MAG: DMT family transporter, partial [Proteobacteria bacterium]|nr:DMT family transporter [Pseudomonadota bacterium]